MSVQVNKTIEVEGFILLVEVKSGQRRGYLFRGCRGDRQLFPKSYSVLSEEERVRLLKEEIDVYCRWSADDQAFGFWTEGKEFVHV